MYGWKLIISFFSVLLTPDSTVLTIKKEQEIACVNITVMDDLSVEERDVVNVSLALMNFTFYAGVNITRETAAILIDDNDGKFTATHIHPSYSIGWSIYIISNIPAPGHVHACRHTYIHTAFPSYSTVCLEGRSLKEGDGE